MKIAELTDPTKNLNIDLKIIQDRMEAKEHAFKDGNKRLIKTVVVVDADAEDSKNSALLDLYGDDISKFKFGDKIRLINCYAKKRPTKYKEKGEQFFINYGLQGGKPSGRYEKIEDDKQK